MLPNRFWNANRLQGTFGRRRQGACSERPVKSILFRHFKRIGLLIRHALLLMFHHTFQCCWLILKSRHCTKNILVTSGTKKMHQSEEHTSELQSLMRISYAVFCLK